ncbi:hypothetical protein [Nocardioides sp. GXQ0305]|uniref:hypothetical protein n=1 Tax=Nocardioides sp. GXQ0305 TaxID=3423912 RepID=UPI003D7CF36D
MSEKNTFVRSLHDVGLAAWFGSSLMGAVGLNGAAAAAHDPQERLRLAGIGWKKWQPFDAAAVGAHLVGGTGLLATNKARIATQPGARAVTVVKTALTGAAVGLSLYNKQLGQQAGRRRQEGPRGTTEPASDNSEELAATQRRLRYTQWALPALTGSLVVLGALQGEQQRPQSLLRNQLRRVPDPRR